MLNPRRFLGLVVFIAYCAVALGQSRNVNTNSITVDVNIVKADVSRHPLGLNTSWMTDSDARRPEGSPPLTSALKALGVKYLRYPGGEEANDFLWSVPPFSVPDASLALAGPDRHFPNQFAQWVTKNHKTLVKPFGFDEFMKDCHAINCEPVIVVALRPYRQHALSDDPVPTRADLIATAASWVRYANREKGYGIKYWEIGNEYWNAPEDFSGPKETVAEYIQDVIDFSRAMKKEDPSIWIGAGAYRENDAQEILDGCSRDINFLAVHPYPLWFGPNGFLKSDFRSYQQSDSWDADLIAFEKAIDNANISVEDKERIKIASTETNSLTGGTLHPGSSPSDLWHGMALFDFLGQQMSHEKNLFSLVWASRWVSQEFSPKVKSGENALDNNNHITATGFGLAIWGNYLLEQLVDAKLDAPDPLVHAFASYDDHTGTLHIFIINKDIKSHVANVSLSHYSVDSSVASRMTLSGDGPTDPAPTFRQGSAIILKNHAFTTQLPGPSITVVIIRGLSNRGLNELGNPGFEQDLAHWKFTGPVGITYDAHLGVRAISVSDGGTLSQSVTGAGEHCELSAYGKITREGLTGLIGIEGMLAGKLWERQLMFTSSEYERKGISFAVPSGLKNVTAMLSAKGGSGSFRADDLFFSCHIGKEYPSR